MWRVLRKLFGQGASANPTAAVAAPEVVRRRSRESAGRKSTRRRSGQSAVMPPLLSETGFKLLNQQAPLKVDVNDTVAYDWDSSESFVCRETVLGRNQRIAGYQFMLRENARNHIRAESRRVHHAMAEVLVNNLVSTRLAPLLGHRLAFIDVPDSFLWHDCLAMLEPSKTVLVLTTLMIKGQPDGDQLCQRVQALCQAGFRICLTDPGVVVEQVPLLPHADMIMLKSSAVDARRGLKLSGKVEKLAPQAKFLIRELPSIEDFRFSLELGASYFQGTFITRREDWHDRHLSSASAHVVMLLQRLRQDADTHEIVSIIKQDAALSLRLLRYINSSANGLPETISSIERAFLMLGRAQLRRWLTLLLYINNGGGIQGAAALENAQIRARMMELLASRKPSAEREMLFLTGLLSLVDVALQVPMEKVLSALNIAPEIKMAILQHAGPFADLLNLAIAYESGNAERIFAAARVCGLEIEQVSAAHLSALQWAWAISDI